MIEVTFADLHNPVFLAGTNLGQKLDVSKRTGLKLKYDFEHYKLWIEYNGITCFTPDANILSCQPKNPKELGVKVTTEFVAPAEIVKTAGPSNQVADISHAQGETPPGYRKGKQ